LEVLGVLMLILRVKQISLHVQKTVND